MNNGFTSVYDTESGIKELQRYLYYVALYYGLLPPVLTGVYGELTSRAVRDFQEYFGLSATGDVDESTWNTLVKEFKNIENRYSPPDPVYIFPSPLYVVTPGEESTTVLIIQAFLALLQNDISFPLPITADGIYKKSDIDAVKTLQKIHRIPVTGQVDKVTWNAIASDIALFNGTDE